MSRPADERPDDLLELISRAIEEAKQDYYDAEPHLRRVTTITKRLVGELNRLPPRVRRVAVHRALYLIVNTTEIPPILMYGVLLETMLSYWLRTSQIAEWLTALTLSSLAEDQKNK